MRVRTPLRTLGPIPIRGPGCGSLTFLISGIEKTAHHAATLRKEKRTAADASAKPDQARIEHGNDIEEKEETAPKVTKGVSLRRDAIDVGRRGNRNEQGIVKDLGRKEPDRPQGIQQPGRLPVPLRNQIESASGKKTDPGGDKQETASGRSPDRRSLRATAHRIATSSPALETARLSRNVLSVTGSPAHQYSLKKIGKNPAMTVVANAEFAQSYIAQESLARRSSLAWEEPFPPGAGVTRPRLQSVSRPAVRAHGITFRPHVTFPIGPGESSTESERSPQKKYAAKNKPTIMHTMAALKTVLRRMPSHVPRPTLPACTRSLLAISSPVTAPINGPSTTPGMPNIRPATVPRAAP